jgi:thiamine-monophosphate kinase
MSGSSAEDDLIARHFAPLAGAAGLGLRDDAALLQAPDGCDLVVTCDALVGGVHFFVDDPAGAIAKKALRVNLSDLAAKGAQPIGFLLALALPPKFDESQLVDFAHGLGEDARAFACPLVGGDTVSTPGPLTIAITAFGSVPHGRMIPRTGVQPGDLLHVTGSIGDAALGLEMRRRGEFLAASLDAATRNELLDRYLLPRPRLALQSALREFAHAAMDVSDGLIGDLSKMLRVSGLSARVRLADVPLSSAARALIAVEPDLCDLALTGGDDYEILVATPPGKTEAFARAAQAAGVAVSVIGEATADRHAPLFADAEGRARSFARGSYSHL